MPADGGRQVIEQRRALDRIRPWLGIRERDRMPLPTAVVRVEPCALGGDQFVEDAGANIEPFCRALALLLVLQRCELGEPGDLRIGRARFLLLALRFLGLLSRSIVRRLLDQCSELLAGVAGGEPIRDITTLWNLRPMLCEI